MSGAEWIAVISAVTALVGSAFGFVRSYRADLRSAHKDELADLRDRVDRLTHQVSDLNDLVARQTRYIGALQYLLQRNGIASPTFAEWTANGEQLKG